MKAREWEPLINAHLLPHMPGYAYLGKHVFVSPIGHVLQGFSFKPSYERECFHLEVFAQLLAVPCDYIILNNGRRLMTGYLHPGTEESVMQEVLKHIQREGIPFHKCLKTPRDMHRFSRGRGRPTVHQLQNQVFCSILEGEYERARREVDTYEREVENASETYPSPPWLLEEIKRMDLVKATLYESTEAAYTLMLDWREQTLRNLKLTDYAVMDRDLLGPSEAKPRRFFWFFTK